MRKLDEGKVRSIRRARHGACPACGEPLPIIKMLSARYRVARSTVSRIRRGMFWKRTRAEES